ncbi:MAG: hypothetical protein V4723_06165 [Pseudomonadota bacterium]
MRYQNGIVGIVTLALAVLTLVGSAYTDQFPQVSQAESVGFDALAHDLFDGLLADAPAEKSAP